MRYNAQAMTRPAPKRLPPDATLLPLSRGELLVSRELAVFCPVPPEHLAALRRALDGGGTLSGLDPTLVAALERHGLFAPPRPVEPDPPSVQFQLTNGCNLACAYCCTNSREPRAEEVSWAQMERAAHQTARVLGGPGRVAILGGEPLLVPWALDLAELLLELGHELTLFTNGTLLATDEARLRRVAALQRGGAEVRVSLCGPNAALCDEAAGAPRFEAALAGIAALDALGAEVVVDLMVLPRHVDALAAELPGLRRRLPRGTAIALGVLYLSGRERGEHMFASRAALEQALDRIAFEAGEQVAAPRRGPLAFRREGCGCALGNHLNVRSDGTLFNCFKMEEPVGHLSRDALPAVAAALRAAPHRAAELPVCRDCPLATLCGGGCRAENALYSGDPGTPICAPWRVRVLCELLAEGQVEAPDWPLAHLWAEARARNLAPEALPAPYPSRHIDET